MAEEEKEAENPWVEKVSCGQSVGQA